MNPLDTDTLFSFFCPGRVNLIGEHIDYNGGLVLPAALSLGITATVRYRLDQCICLSSTSECEQATIRLADEISFDPGDGWANYPKGVVRHLLQDGHVLPGCEIAYSSTLPVGAGLSSSAAIELVTAYLLLYPTQRDQQDRVYLARLCQAAENQFVGVNCGIMDQFAVAMGKQDHAILLDCSNLNYQHVPLLLNDYVLLIINTNKKRELATSKYNERRAECEKALADIQQYRPLKNLCQANEEEVQQWVSDPTSQRRAWHVVSENERVRQAVSTLQQGKLAEFGKLMLASHLSLQQDYEVTGLELDTVVAAASKHSDCLGVRMTGAGFGGCAIALVSHRCLDDFAKIVGAEYQQQTGLTAQFYASQIGDGVRRLP